MYSFKIRLPRDNLKELVNKQSTVAYKRIERDEPAPGGALKCANYVKAMGFIRESQYKWVFSGKRAVNLSLAREMTRAKKRLLRTTVTINKTPFYFFLFQLKIYGAALERQGWKVVAAIYEENQFWNWCSLKWWNSSFSFETTPSKDFYRAISISHCDVESIEIEAHYFTLELMDWISREADDWRTYAMAASKEAVYRSIRAQWFDGDGWARALMLTTYSSALAAIIMARGYCVRSSSSMHAQCSAIDTPPIHHTRPFDSNAYLYFRAQREISHIYRTNH